MTSQPAPTSTWSPTQALPTPVDPGLQPKLIQGLQAQFKPATFDKDVGNASGITPVGQNILVKADECAEIRKSGLMLPPDDVEKMTQAAESGCLHALGPSAFRFFEDGTPWTGRRPAVGERIYFEKYAGKLARGDDGAIYRIMDYRAVGAIMQGTEVAV